jgi:hypothetical protein
MSARLGKMNDQVLTEEQIRLQAAALQAAANGIVITDAQGTILFESSIQRPNRLQS